MGRYFASQFCCVLLSTGAETWYYDDTRAGSADCYEFLVFAVSKESAR